jgi:hypothetical protein
VSSSALTWVAIVAGVVGLAVVVLFLLGPRD